MSTYVLVHGAWHGAWCWERVIPLLERQGHHVITFDLPGHGAEPTPTTAVTLQSYVDRVCAVLDQQAEPVILVGHSMGGIVISQSAEARPHTIQTLVYLTGFLPTSGQSLFDIASTDAEALVLPNAVESPDHQALTIPAAALGDVFFNDCSDADVAWAARQLVPQAIQPFVTPLQLTDANFGQVDRVYITCLQDHAISPATQRRMYEDTPCRLVIPLDTSHSAFLSNPEALATVLGGIAA